MARGLNQAGVNAPNAEGKRFREMNYAHLIKDMRKNNNKNSNARLWMERPAYCIGTKREEWERERGEHQRDTSMH